MSRGIWSTVFKNFIASLRPRQINGNLMGEDYMKNKYFEIPADPRGGKRRSTRWFEPAEKGNFEQEIPAEWEAWLRNRRTGVPTSEEILRSLAVSQMKKENAKKVAIQNPFVHEPSEVPSAPKFPVFDDYEMPDRKRK